MEETFRQFRGRLWHQNDAQKYALLLDYIREELDDTYCALPEPRAPTQVPPDSSSSEAIFLYTVAGKKLDACFEPRVNTTFDIYRFRQAKLRKDDFLDESCAKLRQLAWRCAFAYLESEVKNQILLFTTLSRLRWRAMLHDLNVHGILKQGRLFEEVEHNVTAMEQGCQHPSPRTATTLFVSSMPTSRSHPPNRDGKIPPPLLENSRQARPDTTYYKCGRSWLHEGGRAGWVIFSDFVVLPGRLLVTSILSQQGHQVKLSSHLK